MYVWLKIFHISAMAIWFAGLCFLPHLLVARHRGSADADPDFFNPVTNTLYFRVMTPAGVLTVFFGMLLLWSVPVGAWLVLKVTLIMVVVFIHLYLGVLIYEMGEGRDRHDAAFYRVLGWVPILVAMVLLALTAAKPVTFAGLPEPPGVEAKAPTQAPSPGRSGPD